MYARKVILMSFPHCPHPNEAAAPRVPIHGSRLVLCPICWIALDPSPRAAPQVVPDSTPAGPAGPVEPPAPAPSPPRGAPTTVPELPEEFGVPLSWPRFKFTSGFLRPRRVVLTLLVSIPFTLYLLWFYLLHYPRFDEYTDPTRQYAVMFPARPVWSGGGRGGGSDGEAQRSRTWVAEEYQVRVSRLGESRFRALKVVNSRTLAQAISNVDSPVLVRARLDDYRATASAQYEQWETVRHVTVGQVLIVNGYVYELTVRGQAISIGDSRAQRFFDSFRLSAP